MTLVVFGETRGESYYIRPHCPSKADGRKGTRRSWKRENPPGVYMLITAKGPGDRFEHFWSGLWR